MFPLPTPHPTYFTHTEPCKIMVDSRIMRKIIVSCKFVTFNLIIITFLLLQYYSCRLIIQIFLLFRNVTKLIFYQVTPYKYGSILIRYCHSLNLFYCFLTFEYLIRLIVGPISIFLSIPNATLWYFQLSTCLSIDISENPGPQYINHTGGNSPYFSFCNWNLNTLGKDKFSRITLLNAHNSTGCLKENTADKYGHTKRRYN